MADATALDALASRLDANGVRARRAPPRALADERHVADLILFQDLAGNRLEVFHAPAVACDPFRPGPPISGFCTGPLGMGHAVLNVEDTEPLLSFYRDLLGFRVSDYALKPYKLYFFHINGRHHSFAIVGSGKQSLHHFMVELCSLEMSARAMISRSSRTGPSRTRSGRHTNDYMTSF
ncbi:MAG: VOC family protein [Alphaproteobacteria bacterium]|nr:VOC family protein [Alphaproteobacteria bacterium]MBV9687838.1 VOC family protein [Alphaproteobacteria bacterium]